MSRDRFELSTASGIASSLIVTDTQTGERYAVESRDDLREFLEAVNKDAPQGSPRNVVEGSEPGPWYAVEARAGKRWVVVGPGGFRSKLYSDETEAYELSDDLNAAHHHALQSVEPLVVALFDGIKADNCGHSACVQRIERFAATLKDLPKDGV